MNRKYVSKSVGVILSAARRSVCLLVLVFLFPQSAFAINEIRMEVRAEDGHGVDTFFVNQPGKIYLVMSAEADLQFAFTAFTIASDPSPGTHYLPINRTDFTFFPAIGAFFGISAFDAAAQSGSSPDSFSVISLSASVPNLWGQDVDIGYLQITPTVLGTLTIDTVYLPGIAEGTALYFLSQTLRVSDGTLPFSFPAITVTCEGAVSPDSTDSDCDGIPDVVDNCPGRFNPEQLDYDGDGFGDSCQMPEYLTPLTVVAREYDESLPDSLGSDPELNLRVRDPDGFGIGYDTLGVFFNDIGLGASYFQVVGSDSVVISEPKSGSYIIEAVAIIGADPSKQYRLSIRIDGTVGTVFEPKQNPITSPALPPETQGQFLAGSIIDTFDYQTVPYAFGDANGNRTTNIADAIFIINMVFNSGAVPVPLEAGDANCNGSVNIADAIYIINTIFNSGPEAGCG